MRKNTLKVFNQLVALCEHVYSIMTLAEIIYHCEAESVFVVSLNKPTTSIMTQLLYVLFNELLRESFSDN